VDGHEVRLVPRSPPTAANPDRGVGDPQGRLLKYGYGLKGTSLLLFRERALRNGQYFFQTGWTGGKYCSPGIDGSRSSGLLAATWAGMVATGRDGYLRYAQNIFDTSYAMQDAVRSHPELRLIGEPSFLFAFTSSS